MKHGIQMRADSADRLLVYVWEWPVRITHWLIFLCVLVLSASGFYIGHPFLSVPGEARDHFVTGTVKLIHFYAAIVFTLAALSRLLWLFLGNYYARWTQFVPASRERLRNIGHMLQYYLFLRRDPQPAVGHNALAGAAYILLFAMYLLMIATGFAMYTANAHVEFPMRFFGFLMPLFGGLQTARWIHHVGMWLLLMFVAHHVFSALEISGVENNSLIGSMISGWKLIRREVLPGAGA
jgi:Ni/Fe-hydrogenase 1 B-type cytochrome subunit